MRERRRSPQPDNMLWSLSDSFAYASLCGCLLGELSKALSDTVVAAVFGDFARGSLWGRRTCFSHMVLPWFDLVLWTSLAPPCCLGSSCYPWGVRGAPDWAKRSSASFGYGYKQIEYTTVFTWLLSYSSRMRSLWPDQQKTCQCPDHALPLKPDSESSRREQDGTSRGCGPLGEILTHGADWPMLASSGK